MGKGLTECKTCGGTIAKSAKRCPHCGAKNNTQTLGDIALGITLLIFGIYLIGYFAAPLLEPAKLPACDEEQGHIISSFERTPYSLNANVSLDSLTNIEQVHDNQNAGIRKCQATGITTHGKEIDLKYIWERQEDGIYIRIMPDMADTINSFL